MRRVILQPILLLNIQQFGKLPALLLAERLEDRFLVSPIRLNLLALVLGHLPADGERFTKGCLLFDFIFLPPIEIKTLCKWLLCPSSFIDIFEGIIYNKRKSDRINEKSGMDNTRIGRRLNECCQVSDSP